MSNQPIRRLLQERKQEIQAELSKLDAVLSAFETNNPDTHRTARRKTRRKRRPIDTARIMDAVTQRPGLTAGQISTRVKIPRSSCYRALYKLAGEGQVIKQGAHWYPALAST